MWIDPNVIQLNNTYAVLTSSSLTLSLTLKVRTRNINFLYKLRNKLKLLDNPRKYILVVEQMLEQINLRKAHFPL